MKHIITSINKHRYRIGLSSLLLLTGLWFIPTNAWRVTAAGGDPLSSQAIEAFFDAALEQQMAEDHVVGATVAVVQGSDIIFARGYGYADLEDKVPVEAERTLFYIGSDGKLFTWTAVMQLVEQGKLDLHADVNTYLDFEVPEAFDGPITMHHLMTHTSGFEEELNALLAEGPADILPLREFLVCYMPRRVYPPGQVFAYSNYGTALAGYIVERVSGESYEGYLNAHLLEPLGMRRSAAVQPLPPELADDMSKGYHYQAGRYDALDFEWVAAAPCAAVRGTATDIARFMIAHLNQGCVDGACILQTGTLADMHRQQFTHHPALTGMAYGFVESRVNGRRILWHLGESARFTTLLALLPEEGVGLLVSYNTPVSDGRAILFSFLDEFYPVDSAPLEARALPGWAQRTDAISGTYVPAQVAHTSPQKLIGWLGSLSVRAEDDGTLLVGERRYVETEPWLFHEQDGDRQITFGQEIGRQWLFWGPLAYFKVPWYQTLAFHLPLVAACVLIFVSAWVAWPIAAWINRRRDQSSSAGTRVSHWVAAGLGLINVGLLAWFVVLMLNYGETYIYPEDRVDLIVRLYWLAVPLTGAALVLMARAWTRREQHWAWRVHYTLVAIASVSFLGFLAFWNLLTGLPV